MELIRVYANAPVIGITINHQGMTKEEVREKSREYEEKYRIPACDVLWDGPDRIVDAIIDRFFPEKRKKR